MKTFGVLTAQNELVRPEDALPGRDRPIETAERHAVLGTPLRGPWPDAWRLATFGMGCFWGAEELFWKTPGVRCTVAGYAGGYTPNPTYTEVCSGLTGHAEVVRVVYDPAEVGYETLLRLFWENHDPTQVMRQGADIGSQYRSIILVHDAEQRAAALASRDAYQRALTAAGKGRIATQIVEAGRFYHAEAYHQQYLHHNPGGYCGLVRTGVRCPEGLGVSAG